MINFDRVYRNMNYYYATANPVMLGFEGGKIGYAYADWLSEGYMSGKWTFKKGTYQSAPEGYKGPSGAVRRYGSSPFLPSMVVRRYGSAPTNVESSLPAPVRLFPGAVIGGVKTHKGRIYVK